MRHTGKKPHLRLVHPNELTHVPPTTQEPEDPEERLVRRFVQWACSLAAGVMAVFWLMACWAGDNIIEIMAGVFALASWNAPLIVIHNGASVVFRKVTTFIMVILFLIIHVLIGKIQNYL